MDAVPAEPSLWDQLQNGIAKGEQYAKDALSGAGTFIFGDPSDPLSSAHLLQTGANAANNTVAAAGSALGIVEFVLIVGVVGAVVLVVSDPKAAAKIVAKVA